jgi:predicted nucleic-acid-binding protein
LIVDTNVLIRTLGQGSGAHTSAARARVATARSERRRLTVLSATVLQVSFVLASTRSGFGWERNAVADAIETILDEEAFEVEHAQALRASLVSYRARSIELLDCFLSAMANERGTKVLSFDDDLRKLGNREVP